MKTTTNLSSSGMKIEFIRYMKYAGALVSPKDNQIFIKSISGRESHFWNITRLDFDLMITRA
jgi:hypothetical protein